MDNIIKRAIKEAGGITALAKGLGITHNAIYSWHRVPAERVLDVECVTGISRHDIRPDIYPRDAA
jgi:DNA-binding transcriptional regulator YdaS (Cro superfamily)